MLVNAIHSFPRHSLGHLGELLLAVVGEFLWLLGLKESLHVLFVGEFNKNGSLELSLALALDALVGDILTPLSDGVDGSKLLEPGFKLFLTVLIRLSGTKAFLYSLVQYAATCLP